MCARLSQRMPRPGRVSLIVVSVLLLAAVLLAGCSSHRTVATGVAAPQPQHMADTDGDSVADALDDCDNTPAGVAVDSFGCPVTLYLRLTVPHDQNAPRNGQAFAAQLARIAEIMKANPDSVLRIEGHSAPAESEASARTRSLLWAQQAAQQLQLLHGIEKGHIEAAGMGAQAPLVSNATPEGRRRNQRLEFILQGHYSDAAKEPAMAAARQKPLPRERLRPKAPDLPQPENLRFAYGGTDLVPQDSQRLQALGRLLAARPGVRVHLVGHTDSKGSEAFNLKLSRRRAEQVRDMLVARYSVAAERISTEGKGENAPVASNDTEAGRLANRRVSVTLLPKAPGRTASTQAQETQAATISQHSASTAPGATREIPRVQPGSTAPVALDPHKDYQVTVSISQCKLWLYEKQADGAKKLVRSYDVATPKPGTPGPEGLGHVTRIDFNPWWVPTENLKRAALRKGRTLPDQVRPGSSANPMGKFKIHLSHGQALRIHGTNQPRLIGRRVSAGCIRMQNDQGLEMARAIDEGTEVLVVE